MTGISQPPDCNLAYRPYRRPFARPLHAAWGTWPVREGTLVRLADPATGTAGFGEIAPLPGKADTGAGPEFALWSARQGLLAATGDPASARSAALLTLGEDTPEAIARLRAGGTRTCKLKVGLAGADREWTWLQRVVTSLDAGERLRLDPNRSWTRADWDFWRPRLNGLSAWIEFLEEPFAPGLAPAELLRAAQGSPVPLALDESLLEGDLNDWLQRGWPGYWIIKPSLLGDAADWLSPLSRYSGRVVISSVFETGIGLSALIRLAAGFAGTDHGLGTQAYFSDELGARASGAVLTALTLEEQHALWNRLPEA